MLLRFPNICGSLLSIGFWNEGVGMCPIAFFTGGERSLLEFKELQIDLEAI